VAVALPVKGPVSSGKCAAYIASKPRFAACILQQAAIEFAKLIGTDIVADEVRDRSLNRNKKTEDETRSGRH
jgi:hypothetical protein